MQLVMADNAHCRRLGGGRGSKEGSGGEAVEPVTTAAGRRMRDKEMRRVTQTEGRNAAAGCLAGDRQCLSRICRNLRGSG